MHTAPCSRRPIDQPLSPQAAGARNHTMNPKVRATQRQTAYGSEIWVPSQRTSRKTEKPRGRVLALALSGLLAGDRLYEVSGLPAPGLARDSYREAKVEGVSRHDASCYDANRHPAHKAFVSYFLGEVAGLLSFVGSSFL